MSIFLTGFWKLFFVFYLFWHIKIHAHHQNSTIFGKLVQKDRATPALPPLSLSCFYIHSKTGCRGFKSFCPCQKSQVSHLRYLTFFVSGHNDLATRRGCAPRSACRGASACQWHASYEPTEPVGETAGRQWRPSSADRAGSQDESVPFLSRCYGRSPSFSPSLFRVFASVCTCSNPLSSLPAPKTHPVLPFSGFFGCVFSFFALLDAQNFWARFCALCRIAFTD